MAGQPAAKPREPGHRDLLAVGRGTAAADELKTQLIRAVSNARARAESEHDVDLAVALATRAILA